MSELFNEIEEEIKQEKFDRLWRSFGRVMVLASVALVAVTVIFVLWQNNSQNFAEAKTGKLLQGIGRLEIEDYRGAIPIFSELAADKTSPYYGIAILRKAQAQDLSGDKEGAIATYAELAKTSSTFAEIAELKGQIAETPTTSALYHTLAEYKAWQLLNDGKKVDAVAIFERLAHDENSPRTLADRAKEVLRTIAPEKLQPIDKKAENE